MLSLHNVPFGERIRWLEFKFNLLVIINSAEMVFEYESHICGKTVFLQKCPWSKRILRFYRSDAFGTTTLLANMYRCNYTVYNPAILMDSKFGSFVSKTALQWTLRPCSGICVQWFVTQYYCLFMLSTNAVEKFRIYFP